MNKTKAVIHGSLIIAFVIAILNNVWKYKRLPGVRFFVGSILIYAFCNALLKLQDELAKNVAIAISIFVILGEGGGLLDRFLGEGTADTTLDTRPDDDVKATYDVATGGSNDLDPAIIRRRETGMNAVSAWTGLYAEKPVIPNSYVG